MKHQPPQWMLDATILPDTCPDCRYHLRFAQNQTFCIRCWESRTREMVERAQRSIDAYQRRLREAMQPILEDDTNGYRIYQDEAATSGDWKTVMQFKWRIVVLEATGKRLPMQAYEPEKAAA